MLQPTLPRGLRTRRQPRRSDQATCEAVSRSGAKKDWFDLLERALDSDRAAFAPT
jgi:hypothetical protein